MVKQTLGSRGVMYFGAGLLAVCALLTLAGEWSSLGIVAGIPLTAANCLLLGLAAAGAAASADG